MRVQPHDLRCAAGQSTSHWRISSCLLLVDTVSAHFRPLYQSRQDSGSMPCDPGATPENKLLFQAFEWHTASQPPSPHETRSDSSHWSRVARLLPKWKQLGVSSVWVPPGCKANAPQGNGYDCYDLWDLGISHNVRDRLQANLRQANLIKSGRGAPNGVREKSWLSSYEWRQRSGLISCGTLY